MELVEFLRARLDDKEWSVRDVWRKRLDAPAITYGPAPFGNEHLFQVQIEDGDRQYMTWDEMCEAFMERAEPNSHMLADIEAKRGIVERCAEYLGGHFGDDFSSDYLAEGILSQLALPFADHPDYDEGWRV